MSRGGGAYNLGGVVNNLGGGSRLQMCVYMGGSRQSSGGGQQSRMGGRVDSSV